MTGRPPRTLWVSTSTTTQGGIATCVRTLSATGLWERWGVRHVATHRDGSSATKALTFARGLVRYAAEMVLRRPDLVHIHMSSAGSFVRKAALAWLAYLLRVPVVLHVHSGRFHLFHDRAPAPLRRVIAATLTRADVVIALGELMRSRLAAIAPDARLTSLPNPVPISPVTRRPAGAAPHVVFLGRIWDKKGAFALLEAWAKVGPGSGHLTMAGDGEHERARTTARELGVADSVTVHDWLSTAQVDALLADADVLALPSENEGQPMVVLEAMSRGLAVLATRVGGIPEIVSDGVEGLLVPSHDAGALADALGDLLADEGRRRALGEAGAARARSEFAADAVAARIEGIYHEVLSGRGQRARGPVSSPSLRSDT
ncbi:glycosyltransferase family 4 protein [Actinomycetospora sp. CA-053990]|uniref:glycosyltransferase family 4 protein n=1 Tax=Actinomycetospora sp. CA-053990 TaxID=3239891 RepID=UPI003D89F788